MKEISFAWDHKKAQINRARHHISFEEACAVFRDEKAFEYYDPEHSETEDRFLMLGVSTKMRVLVVSYCYRSADSVIRIISARKATKKETDHYSRSNKL